MEGLLTQLKLNAYGQNSYDFEKDLRGEEPSQPVRSFSANFSNLKTPVMKTSAPEIMKLMGVDVETIIMDRGVGLFNLLRKEGKDYFQIETIMKSEEKKKMLLIELTKKFRDFYKKLGREYLTPEQKQARIESKLSDFRTYPAPFVRKADEIAETLPTDDEIESIVDTVDLRGFFPDTDEEEFEEEVVGEAEPLAPTSEMIERALVAGSVDEGTSGGALESIVADGEGGASLPTVGLRTDGDEVRPPPREEFAGLDELRSRLRFQRARFAEVRDIEERAQIATEIEFILRQIDYLEGGTRREEGFEVVERRRRRRREPRAEPIPFIRREAERSLEEQLMEEVEGGLPPPLPED